MMTPFSPNLKCRVSVKCGLDPFYLKVTKERFYSLCNHNHLKGFPCATVFSTIYGVMFALHRVLYTAAISVTLGGALIAKR